MPSYSKSFKCNLTVTNLPKTYFKKSAGDLLFY